MEENKMTIEIRPEIAKGSYSNLAVITHSHSEFIIDFATMLPGLPKAEVSSRVIMAPEHVKRLLNALADNINKYENQFGSIDLGETQQKNTFNLADFNNGAKS